MKRDFATFPEYPLSIMNWNKSASRVGGKDSGIWGVKRKKSTDEYLAQMGYSLFDEYERAVSFASIPEQERILDAGTGSARMTRVLMNKGYQIISGDIEGEKLAEAARYSAPSSETQKTHWVQLDLYQLCFRDHLFDHIVCANLFHELQDPVSVLRELLRVFSGRGKMILLDFTDQGFSIIDEVHRLRHGKEHSIERPISSNEIRGVLEDRTLHIQTLDLPLNWVYVAEGKRG
jgi:SAM-dependent methyltransferase